MITGATGFVGSALTRHYLQSGYAVHGTHLGSADEHPPLPAGLTLHAINLEDAAAVGRLIGAVGPAIVHHLAAQSSTALSLQDPMRTISTNASMQYNVLEAIRQDAPEARVLVVGSADEYGDVAPEDNPIMEEQPLRPLTPYALSKVVQDLMGLQYAVAHGLQVVRVRPFLQLGRRRSDTFAVGSFARQIAEIEAGTRPAEIHVGNIDLQRDFCDVRDVARACALAAEGGTPGDVYNIASGTAHTLRDLLATMLGVSGVQAAIVRDEGRARSTEPEILVGNAARLRHATGWTPEISFEEAATATLDDWRERVRRKVEV